jgi:hypothetical protein
MNDTPKTGGHKRSKGRDVPPPHDTVEEASFHTPEGFVVTFASDRFLR